jgi:hypothetical protein
MATDLKLGTLRGIVQYADMLPCGQNGQKYGQFAPTERIISSHESHTDHNRMSNRKKFSFNNNNNEFILNN